MSIVEREMGRDLVVVAEEINREHAACVAAGEAFAAHAYRCGELLIEAKAAVRHGEWLPWLAENFAAGERMAQRYMKIAAAGNPTHVSDLSLNEALRQLAPPKSEAPPAEAFDGTHWGKAMGILLARERESDRFAELAVRLMEWHRRKHECDLACDAILASDDPRRVARMSEGGFPPEWGRMLEARALLDDLWDDLLPDKQSNRQFQVACDDVLTMAERIAKEKALV